MTTPYKTRQNPYNKTIRGTELDVYDILHAYEVEDHAVGHAIKKLLCLGKRSGGKGMRHDLTDAIWSLERALQTLDEQETDS